MRDKFFLGIDPGKAGGIAVVSDDLKFAKAWRYKWQSGLLDAGTGETKQRSLNMARRLFPNVDLSKKYDATNGETNGQRGSRTKPVI